MADYTIGNSNRNCGCTCVNDSVYAACGDAIPTECDDQCTDAPCSYAILFMCDARFGGPIDYRRITTLWRDCLWRPGSYSARARFTNPLVCQTVYIDDAPVEKCYYRLSDESGGPCVTPCDVRLKDCSKGYAQWFPPVWGNLDPNAVSNNPSNLEWKPLDFTCCQTMPVFGEFFRAESECLDPNPFPFGGCPQGSVYQPCSQDFNNAGQFCPCSPAEEALCVRCGWNDFHGVAFAAQGAPGEYGRMAEINDSLTIVWQLTVSGSTAAIYGFAYEWYETRDPKYRVVYQCSSFNCLGRSTFERTDWTGWVEEEDITPDNNNDHPALELPLKVCVTPYSTAFKTPCDTTVDACNCRDAGWTNGIINLQTPCLGGHSRDIIVYRNYDSNLIPSCITLPSGPCGYFFGYGYLTDYGKDLAFVLWCDGSRPWNLDVYCTTDDWATCTKVCEADVTEFDSDMCSFYAFDWSCDDLGDCCAAVCTECDPTGKTLNFDISGPGNGSGTVTGSGSFCFVKTLSNGDRMSVKVNMATCTVQVGCNAIDCTDFNCLTTFTIDFTSCDPFDMTITFTRSGFGGFCNACGIGAWTIHIYE